MKKRPLIHAALLLSTLLIATPTQAWHDEGHYYAARAAVNALPEDVPEFFRQGVGTVAHCSLDPDVFKVRDLPQLNHSEYPEHFLDIELLKGKPLPAQRSEFLKLCYDNDLDPSKVGTLPYAITEWTQKLTMAFAEHRQHPDNPHIRAKCLVYAGILSHYAADLHMPLHTTVHWDGRYDENMPYARTGIHTKVDALPTFIPYNDLFTKPLPTPLASSDIFSFTMDEFAKSHKLVDRVYKLEDKLPTTWDPRINNNDVRDFTIERMHAAAAFIADLYLSAWRNSANIEVPDWMDRTIFDDDFDPAIVPPQPDNH